MGQENDSNEGDGVTECQFDSEKGEDNARKDIWVMGKLAMIK